MSITDKIMGKAPAKEGVKEEISTNQEMYFGMNILPNNVIMGNCKRLVNPNDLVFGMPGFGMTFYATSHKARRDK